MNQSKCRSCGKEIVWAKTQHGKAVPLDPKALVFSVMMEKGEMLAISITGHKGHAGDTIMVSHFATCPDANKWSGHKPAEPQPDKHFSEPAEVQ